jgi:hypothetical protein
MSALHSLCFGNLFRQRPLPEHIMLNPGENITFPRLPNLMRIFVRMRTII